MKRTTLAQGAEVLRLFGDTPSEITQALLEGGFLADLAKAQPSVMNRLKFRETCGLTVFDTEYYCVANRGELEGFDEELRAIGERYAVRQGQDIAMLIVNPFAGPADDRFGRVVCAKTITDMETREILRYMEKYGWTAPSIHQVLWFLKEHGGGPHPFVFPTRVTSIDSKQFWLGWWRPGHPTARPGFEWHGLSLRGIANEPWKKGTVFAFIER